MGMRLLNRTDPLGLMPVIGRAIAKTNQFFMIMVAAELVAALANPPVLLVQIIHFLFTISTVFQGAVWLRELILGLLERRAGAGASGETLANAMGIIRVIVRSEEQTSELQSLMRI